MWSFSTLPKATGLEQTGISLVTDQETVSGQCGNNYVSMWVIDWKYFTFLFLIVDSDVMIEEIYNIPSLHIIQMLTCVICIVTTFVICSLYKLLCIALTLFSPFNKWKWFFAGILECERWKKDVFNLPCVAQQNLPATPEFTPLQFYVMYSPFYGKRENYYSTSYQQGVKKDFILPYSLSLSYKEIHPSSLKWFHPIGRSKGTGEKTYWISPFVISNS